MRFREFNGGLMLPVSLEEQAILDKIDESELHMIDRTKLSIREQEVARKMVSRGLLARRKVDETVNYIINNPKDLWRD